MCCLIQFGFVFEDSGVYCFMLLMYCFFDVCLLVQQDCNLFVSLYVDLLLQMLVLVDDGEIELLMVSDEELFEESEEDVFVCVIVEEYV